MNAPMTRRCTCASYLRRTAIYKGEESTASHQLPSFFPRATVRRWKFPEPSSSPSSFFLLPLSSPLLLHLERVRGRESEIETQREGWCWSRAPEHLPRSVRSFGHPEEVALSTNLYPVLGVLMKVRSDLTKIWSIFFFGLVLSFSMGSSVVSWVQWARGCGKLRPLFGV